MSDNANFDISMRDTARFRRIVIDVMSEACSAEVGEPCGIGTLGEKQMHAAIKRFICPDREKHEIKIDGSAGCIKKDGGEKKKNRSFVADVLDGNVIYEIQTGGFSPLKAKIEWILENTTYNIVVIHPIAESLWVSYIDSDKGTISPRRKSPRHGRLEDIASDLYFFRDFINDPRFSLVILMMEADQYRTREKSKSGRRVRSSKYEMIPSTLLRAHFFRDREDYGIFLPDSLPEKFTAKIYSEKAKIYGMDTYSMLKTLCHIGLIEECGNIGRAVAYRRI